LHNKQQNPNFENMTTNTHLKHLLQLADSNEHKFRNALESCTPEQLEEFAKASREKNTGWSWPILCAGVELGRRGLHDAVARVMEIALTISPVSIHTVTNYARALHNIGRYTEIPAHIDRFLPREDNEEQALLLYHKANVLFDLGETQQALAFAAEAYECDPTCGQVVFIYGYGFYVQQQYAEALPLFNDAIRIDPEFDTPYLYKAWLYVETGRMQDAVVTLMHLADFAPEFLRHAADAPQFKTLLESEFKNDLVELMAKYNG
jgi:tetratricopeptide (TPR) repeat protein